MEPCGCTRVQTKVVLLLDFLIGQCKLHRSKESPLGVAVYLSTHTYMHTHTHTHTHIYTYFTYTYVSG